MNIIISNSSAIPLYEQIKEQIKGEILNQSLKPGEGLPSIRTLAKELRVSIITSKRAYEELEKEGFILVVPGKGAFVSEGDSERLREAALSTLEGKLEILIKEGKALGLKEEEFIEIIESMYEEV